MWRCSTSLLHLSQPYPAYNVLFRCRHMLLLHAPYGSQMWLTWLHDIFFNFIALYQGCAQTFSWWFEGISAQDFNFFFFFFSPEWWVGGGSPLFLLSGYIVVIKNPQEGNILWLLNSLSPWAWLHCKVLVVSFSNTSALPCFRAKLFWSQKVIFGRKNAWILHKPKKFKMQV